MAAQTRNWADVYVDDIDDRSRLERSALFFLPSAFELCRDHSLSVSKLNSRATIARREDPSLQLAGRAVIGTVFQCKQPVVYDSAIRFIRLANIDLPSDKWLHTSDIVACAFRLRDPEIVADIGLKAQDLVTACHLRKEVVDAALKRMRITYADAHAIWSYLSGVVKDRTDLPATVTDVLTGDQSDFIRTDTRGTYPIAVDRVGKVVPRHSKRVEVQDADDAEYVYSRSNLHAAPRIGHPWAIDQKGPTRS